jgi:predicted TPR repeat methyltransferase
MDDRPQRVDLDPVDYDGRWARLAAEGKDVHGEATLVEAVLAGRVAPGRTPRVLDAGCGTGRVAIRLAELGCDTVGVDIDDALLERAREKAPAATWVRADLATLAPDDVRGPFDAVVMAGNVMIFLAPGTGSTVVTNLAVRLAPGGALVSGFQLHRPDTSLAHYDEWTARAGLEHEARYATWERDPFVPGGAYIVAVDRRVR